MDNRTQLNREIQSAPPTRINHEIAGPDRDADLLERGTVVCDGYTIENRLEVSSGEADLYVCSSDDRQYVAKVYKRKFAVKEEVIRALRSMESPYVAKLFETSTYRGFPIEIIPYYRNGSLQGRVCSYDDLIRMVIPNINEGLKALHKSGILHKDLKPSNIMMADDGRSVAIIDFGISSVVKGDNTVIVTRTGMTPQYSAPETFHGLFLEESDYYSFGITLYELFCGYAPYANMSPEEIEQYISVQRLPFPDNMPPMLQDLISALTYYDITNRRNKGNPNRRWTYDEVDKWLNGESLVIPGEGIGNVGKGSMPPYLFVNESYTDPALFVTALAKNWEEGKKQLFRGMITAHFRTFNQDIAKRCMEAEEEASRTNGKDDIIFWKLLYRIHPELKGFYWKGQVYESLPALGRDILDRLWNKDTGRNAYYKSILSEKLLSGYAAMTAPGNENLKKAAAAMEDSYQLERDSHTDMRKTFYLMAYTLSGQKLLFLDGQKFRTVGELAGYLHSRLDASFEAFERICHKLVDYDGNLDVQLETWLIVLGKAKELSRWRLLMNE